LENKIRAQKAGTSPGVFLKPEHVLCFCARLFGGVNHHAVPLQLVLFLGPLLPPEEVVCELQGTLARSVVDQV
jgi:hypothetical protein